MRRGPVCPNLWVPAGPPFAMPQTVLAFVAFTVPWAITLARASLSAATGRSHRPTLSETTRGSH